MTTIHNEFDNLNDLSATKDFEQSQIKEKGVLDIPMLYQEYSAIENQIDKDNQNLSEATLFASELSNAKVVNRNDALALESISNGIAVLPHVNSYTHEYTIVNYDITMESAFQVMKEFGKNVIKSIYDYILKTIQHLTEQVKNLFKSEKYVNDPAKQSEVKKNAKEVTRALGMSSEVVSNVVHQLSAENRDARLVRINKELRAYLYPEYKELGIISIGGDINLDLLIDEMCEYRLKKFYTESWKAIMGRDVVYKNLVDYYYNVLCTQVTQLVHNTTEIFAGDLNEPPAFSYNSRLFSDLPLQMTDFAEKHTTHKTKSNQISNADEVFKVLSSEILTDVKRMCELVSVQPLDDPRILIGFDTEWLSSMFSTDYKKFYDEIKDSYGEVNRAYRKVESQLKTMHPDRSLAIKNVFADWVVINRMNMTVITVRRSADSLWHMTRKTMVDVRRVLEIFS